VAYIALKVYILTLLVRGAEEMVPLMAVVGFGGWDSTVVETFFNSL